MVRIESLQNEKVKHWNKLKEKKYRDETGLFLIEGDHLIEEALKYHVVKEIISLEEVSFEPSYLVKKEIMKKLSEQETPPTKIAICEKLKEREIVGDVLILDGIQDPGNLGSILRSAVAFEIDNIVLSDTCVDLYNSKVIRSTEGIFFPLNIWRTSLVPFMKTLKEKNYVIVGADIKGEETITFENQNTAIVIGSEGKGISKEVKDLCTSLQKIKMNEACESLNASVSASIFLYERRKQK